jgi:hypothetical protein
MTGIMSLTTDTAHQKLHIFHAFNQMAVLHLYTKNLSADLLHFSLS